MYRLYIANKNYSSWSLRPWVLLRERGIDFEELIQPFGHSDFLAFSPSGKVPCLRDGENVVWDSLAITEYLAERHPGIWPQDPAARAWARCAAAEMHAGFGALRENCAMNCGVRVRMHSLAAISHDLVRLAQLWAEGLQRFGGPFLAGAEFTAVDAFFAPVAFRIQSYGLQLDAQAQAYAQLLLALPSMQAWYADALRETWRDGPHEDDVVRVGVLLEDLREVAV